MTIVPPHSPSRKVCILCHVEKDIAQFDGAGVCVYRICIACVRTLPPVTPGTRRCSACFAVKPFGDFRKGGWCMLCRIEYRKKYNENTPFDKRRDDNLRHNYGITLDDYNLMLFQQGGVCASCGKPETTLHHHGKQKPLSVDHNHATGQVRGLLCHTCNVLLGYLEKDPQRVKALQKYLKKYM